MKDPPLERVFLYRVVDLSTGVPSTTSHVAFADVLRMVEWDWREIGTLAPGATGVYQYEQSAHFPKPPIDAYILRTIADRIDTLNNRAKENEALSRPCRHPSPIL